MAKAETVKKLTFLPLLWKGALFLLIVLLLTQGWLTQIFITKSLSALLGVPIEIEEVRVDFWNSQGQLKDLSIYNPDGFPSGVMASIPKVFFDFNKKDLFKGKLDLVTLEIECDEIRVIRREDQQVNWLSLEMFREQAGGEAETSKLKVDNLVLSMNRATYTDLSGDLALQKAFELDLDHTVYRDVNSGYEIVKIVSWATLKKMGLTQTASLWESLEKKYGEKGVSLSDLSPL